MDAESGTAMFDLGKFVVDDSGWYTYNGSLTTPPCTEGIRWFVQASPIKIVQKQMQRFLK
jgi:carbonic anhydrase